jgi:hypothetical protein
MDKNFNIMQFAGSVEDILEILNNKKKENSKYKEASNKFEMLKSKVDKDTYLAIDSATCFMETIAEEVAFNEGFNTAIRMIMSATIKS